MADKNILGGANPHGLYNPMSESEQEAISRLIEADDLYVEIVDWGRVDKPKITIGDKRLVIRMIMDFRAPDVPQEVPYFDLKLCRRSGETLLADRKPTMVFGKNLVVSTGVRIELTWDIQIDRLPEAFVKSLLPTTRGLTSRVGNTKWNDEQRKALQAVRKGREIAVALDKERLDKVLGAK